MRFTKSQVAAEKNKAADRARSNVRHRKLLTFILGALVGAGAMYASLKPEDVQRGYQRVRDWAVKEKVEVKQEAAVVKSKVEARVHPTTAPTTAHAVTVTPATTQAAE